MQSGTRRVVRTAVLSRVLVLALICIWRSLFDPYDTSASINPPCLLSSPRRRPAIFPSLGSAIERSVVWDSVYFVRIAECGYEYEQTYAFFPLLPVSMSLLTSTVFAPLVPVFGYRAVLALSGYVLSNVAFVAAAVFLYWLSMVILNDLGVAMQASILFCFNPASIFYSSIYSESLYALFAFGGLYYFSIGSNTTATALFALSGSARSNGILNAGYFCFQAIQQAYLVMTQNNRLPLLMQAMFSVTMRLAWILLPFVSFQVFGYFSICLNRIMQDLRPWCKKMPPRLYDFIQGHYWGVGFMRYFQVKQLPNFLLASPILYIALWSIVAYMKKRIDLIFSVGLQASLDEIGLLAKHPCVKGHTLDTNSDLRTTISSQPRNESSMLRQRKQVVEPLGLSETNTAESDTKMERGYYSMLMLPFILHLAFLTMTALFIMHVQVATRFLSASPPIYWFASCLFSSSHRRSSYLIWAYSVAYILLGSLLFSNFYPFT